MASVLLLLWAFQTLDPIRFGNAGTLLSILTMPGHLLVILAMLLFRSPTLAQSFPYNIVLGTIAFWFVIGFVVRLVSRSIRTALIIGIFLLLPIVSCTFVLYIGAMGGIGP